MTSADPGNLERPRWVWPRAAYLHIPFCAHHCGYCDFAIAVGQDSLIDRYLDALAVELSWLGTPQLVETIFLGGGTPSHLDNAQLGRLLRTINQWLPVTVGHEFSIEANPGTLDRDKARLLEDQGVTRVSLGVQSFQPHLLQALERQHIPDDVPRAIEAIRSRNLALSLDLIFGVPGQTLADWENDIARALEFSPDHISTYGLTYEKGTPLWKQRERGLVKSLEEEMELAMYTRCIDVLEENGFVQYEISSFAQRGRRCRHNQVYWANEAYFGFGMGAARYVEGRREVNSRDLRTYIQRIKTGQAATFQSEDLSAEERAFETISLNLRRREGIDRAGFRSQTGYEVDDLIRKQLERLVAQELLADDGRNISLTRRGRYVADAVIEELLRCADPARR